MNLWWQRRSLKLRLAIWFAATASGILLGLTPVVYRLIEGRLHLEFDRQLRLDWNLVEGHLETDGAGRVRWRSDSPAPLESSTYATAWFDVWSRDQALLRHWPEHGVETRSPPQMPTNRGRPFYTLTLDNGLSVRTLEQWARIGSREVILRVFRDESGLHRTLREILMGLALGVPLAAVLTALGGYVMAGRLLRPISVMAERARHITSESLDQRLPNPNPHDELGQLASVFNETLQRLEYSFQSLRQFTADASHELRTPLTALRAVGEVALRGTADAKTLRDTVGSMLEEAQRLNDLVDSLLLLARLEGGRAPLHQEAVSLNQLVTAVCDRMGVLAAEKGQTIRVAGESGVLVTADRLRLGQAAMNILHNAICYGPTGTRIEARVFRRDAEAVIEIADEGSGIAPEHQQKIFDRFYRLDKARSRTEGGAGLGLAIAKLAVEQQGGRIELESQPGHGSRFQIVLPMQGSGSDSRR